MALMRFLTVQHLGKRHKHSTQEQQYLLLVAVAVVMPPVLNYCHQLLASTAHRHHSHYHFDGRLIKVLVCVFTQTVTYCP